MEELFCKELQVNVRCRDCEDRKANIRVTIELQLTNSPVHKRSPVLEGPATFSVVETNAFKHLNHLSLRLVQGSDKEIKDYLAVCLSSLKAEKQAVEMKLKKTEDDLTRQLNYAQQTLSEKTKELDKMRSEWTSQSSGLSSRHSLELQSEREKAAELQSRLQQQTEQIRQELESSHKTSSQQLHSKLTELEASCRELTERKYKNESVIRDLKVKLVGAEEECQRSKQQVLSLRRENGTLDTEVHDKERVVSQLQMRVAVLEQEINDKEQLMRRTKEVLEATQQQKESMEENAESKELHNRKLEATVKSLSEELIKANGIIKKLQGEVRGLVGKIKVKNTVTVSQEKVSKLKEQLETTVQKLNESREVLKTNENVINWLNKQLNEKQLSRKPQSPECMDTPSLLSTAPALRTGRAAADVMPAEQRSVQAAIRHTGDSGGLDSKYFEKRDDSIPIYGLSSNLLHKDFPQRTKPSIASAYFSA
ncbi:Spindle assembly abnormal protein 6 like [Dissostichus eleginoides]|uniref:Spindle assembly abnormal protein 6 like n=1 Tax=Dissostichus eleginoides TaxID=100907 RepID=A0AAD9C807_DISEL|nr:Spindle assembly abnormal protein 6 like [Dissostichus eleginoides]